MARLPDGQVVLRDLSGPREEQMDIPVGTRVCTPLLQDPRRDRLSRTAPLQQTRGREHGPSGSINAEEGSCVALPAPRGGMPACLRPSSSDGPACARRDDHRVSPSSCPAPAIPHGHGVSKSDVDTVRPLRFLPRNPNLLTGLGSGDYESATANAPFRGEAEPASRRAGPSFDEPGRSVRREDDAAPCRWRLFAKDRILADKNSS